MYTPSTITFYKPNHFLSYYKHHSLHLPMARTKHLYLLGTLTYQCPGTGTGIGRGECWALGNTCSNKGKACKALEATVANEELKANGKGKA